MGGKAAGIEETLLKNQPVFLGEVEEFQNGLQGGGGLSRGDSIHQLRPEGGNRAGNRESEQESK